MVQVHFCLTIIVEKDFKPQGYANPLGGVLDSKRKTEIVLCILKFFTSAIVLFSIPRLKYKIYILLSGLNTNNHIEVGGWLIFVTLLSYLQFSQSGYTWLEISWQMSRDITD